MALLIQSNRFDEIPVFYLEYALVLAVANKHSKAMNVLIRSRRFAEIREGACLHTLYYALFNLRLNVIKDLVDVLGVAQLSERGFQGALWGAAAKEGPSGPFAELMISGRNNPTHSPGISEKILRILIESPRFQQACNITRQHALAIAKKDGEREKAEMLIDAGVRIPLMEHLPARLLHVGTSVAVIPNRVNGLWRELSRAEKIICSLLLLLIVEYGFLIPWAALKVMGGTRDTPSF